MYNLLKLINHVSVGYTDCNNFELQLCAMPVFSRVHLLYFPLCINALQSCRQYWIFETLNAACYPTIYIILKILTELLAIIF